MNWLSTVTTEREPKRIARGTALALLVGCTVLTAGEVRLLERHYLAARTAPEDGDPARAKRELKLSLQEDPLHAESHFLLASLRAREGDIDQATVGFRQATKLEPTHAAARYNLGTALLLRGVPTLAASRLEGAVAYVQAMRGTADDLRSFKARYLNIFTYYDGSVGGSGQLPVSGARVASNVAATSYADSSVFFWETPLKVLGGDYTVLASIPYVWVAVSGDVQVGPRTGQTRDSANGIGDIYFVPSAIGWTNGDFKWDGRFGIYAPSGSYSKTSLANPGLGFWTFEPEATFTWISSKFGTEVSAFAGIDFNTENTAASYTSGDVFHLDLTLAQHLPLFGGIVGVGVNGYWIKQFTGDSGSGAVLGSFELKELGVGPVVSYIRKLGKAELAIDVKWLPQIEVSNTMKGDLCGPSSRWYFRGPPNLPLLIVCDLNRP